MAEIAGLDVDPAKVETNMVFVDMEQGKKERLIDFMGKRGIKAGGYGQLRLVTHLDINADDIAVVVKAVKDFTISDGQR